MNNDWISDVKSLTDCTNINFCICFFLIIVGIILSFLAIYVNTLFSELEKAFDRVPRTVLEWTMRKKEIPEVLV